MATADLDEQIERLRKCEYLKEQEVKALCDRAREILCEESNVQRVSSPVTVSFPHHFFMFFHHTRSFIFAVTLQSDLPKTY